MSSSTSCFTPSHSRNSTPLDAEWCLPSFAAPRAPEAVHSVNTHGYDRYSAPPPPPPHYYESSWPVDAAPPPFPSHTSKGTSALGPAIVSLTIGGNSMLPDPQLPPLPPPPARTQGGVRHRDSCNEGKVVELSDSWLDTLQYVFYRGYEHGPTHGGSDAARAVSPAFPSDGVRSHPVLLPGEQRISESLAPARQFPRGGPPSIRQSSTSRPHKTSVAMRKHRDDNDMTELRKIQAEAIGDGIHHALSQQHALTAGAAAAQKPPDDAGAPGVSHELPGQAVRQNSPYQPQCSSYLALSPGGGRRTSDRILVISYHVTNPIALPPRDEPREGDPHLKLGGVLMDLGRVVIGSLIQFITAVAVRQVEMFLHNQGRCALYLNEPDSEGPQLIQLLDRRLWMGPHYALYATGPTAATTLAQYVQRVRAESGATCRRWPRHLVTVERWVPRETYRCATADPAEGGATPDPQQGYPEWQSHNANTDPGGE